MTRKDINDLVKPYAHPNNIHAVWQIINTLIPYGLILYMTYWMITKDIPYFFVLPLLIVAALFLVRIFILFHDCTHSSFMTSKTAMTILGHLFGILTFTTFHQWQREHKEHHRTVGNIDKRGTGDVWTMTVLEYKNASRLKRLGYRLYRHPFFLFVIGPFYVFVIGQRLPLQIKNKKDLISLIITNIGIVSIFLLVTFTIGIRYYLLIQVPIIFIASSLGVWLFFVQHQYEEVYWEESKEWDVTEAALKGSSIYRLPLLLDWFTGNIGYHNIHHLNARIPNYKLRKLFHKAPSFHTSKQIRLLESIRLAKLYLYDEKNKILISRKHYKKQYA
jgi:omega-6 fatty acid desaturase (delta-12 desaturase)